MVSFFRKNNINADLAQWKKVNNSTIQLFLPSYFTADDLNEMDMNKIADSWKRISSTGTLAFEELRGYDSAELETCAQWFTDVFYKRLLYIFPTWSSFIKDDAKCQNIFISNLIGTVLSLHEDPKKLENHLIDIGTKYSKIGVRTLDFGVIGDVLFWSLDRVLKEEMEEDPSLRKAWCKLYCQCLRTLIPVSLLWTSRH